MNQPKPAFQVDLTNCDREPIHTPGSVQSHGMLLVCNSIDWRIAHVSSNCQTLLGDAPERIVGQSLANVLGKEAAADVTETLATAEDSATQRIFNLKISNGQTFHVSVVNSAGRILVELEPVSSDQRTVVPLALVKAVVSRIQSARTVQTFFDLLAIQLRALIGYDRVMVYKFLHDGSGQIIAEDRRHDLEPFLDLHYPASDIPQQARALYLRSWIRLIADVRSEPVPIVPDRGASGELIDLSMSQLRSVSPIHIEYLTNMGVAASMSISIIVGGKLWGLIACHNYSPKVVTADVRTAAELLGQIFSLQIESLEPTDSADTIRHARLRIDKILSEIPITGTPMENLAPRLAELRSLMPCDGAGLWLNGVWAGQGLIPPAKDIANIAKFLNENAHGDLFATNELSRRIPGAIGYAADVSGLLAVPLSRSARDYLMIFRREVVNTVKWAGDPQKPVTVGPLGDRLTPRKSFAVWEDHVRGTSVPWDLADCATAEALRLALLEVVLRLSEVAAFERMKAAERQRLLVAELHHRVKNILALISALVARTHDKNETLSSFVTGLEGRIKALAFAHDQAVHTGVGYIVRLFEAETAPFKEVAANRLLFKGPRLALNAHAYSVVALVVHEMATNAAKYGALSVPNGEVTVKWDLDQAGNCVIEWSESGGPPVQAATRSGFGRTLIERQIPHELNGETDVRYELTGLSARFVIPSKHIVETGEDDPEAFSTPQREPAVAKIQDSVPAVNYLFVEDNFLIALDGQSLLLEAGAKSVEVVSSAEAALTFIAKSTCDAGVLDINLGRGTSMPVADELMKRGIPFVFATGYNDTASIPKSFKGVPLVVKPYSREDLIAAIGKLPLINP